MVKLFSKSLQVIKGGGAPFCAALRAALCAMRSRKRPCQPKTAKRFFGGPGSHGPSGQAKERTRVLPVRRGFSAPGVPRRLPGRPFLCRLPLLWWILCPVPRHFFCKRCVCAGNSLALSVLLVCFVQRAQVFLLLFHVKPKEGSSLFLRCSAALFPTCAPLFCRLYADFCACLSGLRCRCPPCVLCAQFCFVSAVCLPVLRCLHGFSLLFFCPFLPNFFLSNFFSLVAHAADGDFLACPLPWLCFRPAGLAACCFFADFCACLSSLRCLTAVRFVCAVLFCFGCLFACSVLVARAFFSYLLSFALSCLTFTSQTSFHLSLMPRREFPRLSHPVALFPACGSCHLLLFRGLLRPLPVFPFCIVRAGFLFFFTFSCLTFSSQNSFHLSLRPRRASTFFRKESRQRFAKGLRPFEPHSSALRPISPFPALLAGLAALRAANRRLTGKRLKSPGAELSFSSVSVRRGTPAP